MGAISWEGRIYGPSDLFSAAREARAKRWLNARARKFLYHVGICLAADRPVSPRQMQFLARVLRGLQDRGCRVLTGPARSPRRRRPSTVPMDEISASELEALERDIAAMRLFLASATERVEGYWERVQQLKRQRQG